MTRISVEAHLDREGRTVCKVDCNGQRAKLIFDGTDVLLEVADPPRSEEST